MWAMGSGQQYSNIATKCIGITSYPGYVYTYTYTAFAHQLLGGTRGVRSTQYAVRSSVAVPAGDDEKCTPGTLNRKLAVWCLCVC
jgi:hypothetical protein